MAQAIDEGRAHWNSTGTRRDLCPLLNGQILQTYRDNTTHLGLKGMHNRLEELGGQFFLVNGEEGGLIVKVVVPL